MFVCVFVCLSVCLSVCSLLRYCLTVFLPPLPEVGCPIFLEIRNPWGKVMESSGLTFEHFCLEKVSNRRANFFMFFLPILPYKTCWKPRFPMDERPLVEGYIANFGISLDVCEFLRFGWFFRFSKKLGFRLFLVHSTHGGNHASRWIRDLWSKGISLILAYL